MNWRRVVASSIGRIANARIARKSPAMSESRPTGRSAGTGPRRTGMRRSGSARPRSQWSATAPCASCGAPRAPNGGLRPSFGCDQRGSAIKPVELHTSRLNAATPGSSGKLLLAQPRDEDHIHRVDRHLDEVRARERQRQPQGCGLFGAHGGRGRKQRHGAGAVGAAAGGGKVQLKQSARSSGRCASLPSGAFGAFAGALARGGNGDEGGEVCWRCRLGIDARGMRRAGGRADRGRHRGHPPRPRRSPFPTAPPLRPISRSAPPATRSSRARTVSGRPCPTFTIRPRAPCRTSSSARR